MTAIALKCAAVLLFAYAAGGYGGCDTDRSSGSDGRKPEIAAQDEAEFARLRERMVEQQLRARNINDARVLAAMGKVPRHEFVPRHALLAA